MRLFGVHAAISLIPVFVLGAALAVNFKAQERHRALTDAEDQVTLLAHTTIDPLINDQATLNAGAVTNANPLRGALNDGSVLRLRLWSSDLHDVLNQAPQGAAPLQTDDDVKFAQDAANGATTSRVTTLPTGTEPPTEEAVVVYRGVWVRVPKGPTPKLVAVIEVAIPYGPVKTQAATALKNQYRELAVGLGALYLTLLVIALSMSRGLRKEVAFNAFLAEHDHLTDLPNRTLFHRRAGAALRRASRDEPVAIAIIDLDRFKDVNDTLGHHNGDRLLTELARRLDVNTRPEDTVARLGGDEFGVVLTSVTDPEEALVRLRMVIDREVEVSGLPLSVESSIGYVVAPADGTDIDDVLQRADVAMYVAKANHAGVVRYDPEQDDYDAAKLALVAELRHAIDGGQLVLHYQPKTSIADGGVEAMEALVRWQHPTRGLLYPDSFVPIAEQTDLVDRLTDWALDTALEDVQQLAKINEGLAVAVNVSARSLGKLDFARRVTAALEKAGVPSTRLIVEITETALITDPERAARSLSNLHLAGVRVSIDDFGQGQTSLGYLSKLPVHELKIDKSFVSDMLVNHGHAAIVRSIVDLGHNLRMRVVGEGVETDEVLSGLRVAGCDVAQGFLIARPMPYGKLVGWLAERTPENPKRTRRRPLNAKGRVPAAS